MPAKPTPASSSLDRIAPRVREALERLGVPGDLATRRRLPFYEDATELVVAHVSASGREHQLIPPAAASWQALRAAAARDGTELVVISAFRSFERQLELLEAKRARGEPMLEALRVMAPPGCSEHHSGRAIDAGTPGCPPLSEWFEDTDAFAWLARHAAGFGFQLSYPRRNAYGFLYEPWHWCWHAPSATEEVT